MRPTSFAVAVTCFSRHWSRHKHRKLVLRNPQITAVRDVNHSILNTHEHTHPENCFSGEAFSFTLPHKDWISSNPPPMVTSVFLCFLLLTSRPS